MKVAAVQLDEADRRAFVRKLLRWGRANRRAFAWRDEQDPFRVLIAEILLQRSRGTTVAKVYDELFRSWPDAEALAKAQISEIEDVIRPLGLTSRARWVQLAAREVVEWGGVPRSVREMMRLAGVGRYAASATAAAVFNQAVPTVDGTSARVYRRYFGLSASRDSDVDRELWDLVSTVMPRTQVRAWNWAVLDLASAVCLPKVPKCGECPLSKNCKVGSSRILDLVIAAR
jgi:A/G-specific adenine glycosylase